MGAVDEAQSSDSMDPLSNIFGTSLFPRTFTDPTSAGNPSSDELESIHSVMKAMALKSPSKHLDQAKAICDGGSDILNSKFARSLAADDKDVAFCGKRKEKALERRPGLGRKRPQFSLTSKSSQPPLVVEPTLDIDQLQDPEEFFRAHEKFENAKKELQRQMGGSITDPVDHRPSRTARVRRPGLLGKSVSYKHQYSSMLPEGDGTFPCSQEAMDQGNHVQDNCSSQPEMDDADAILQEKELTSSISKTESRVSELFNQLLSDKFESIEEEGVIPFLQESLQIKSIDLDKLCLPEFHDVSKNDITDYTEKMPRRRKTLSDMSNLVNGIRSKTPVKQKQVTESPSLDTPTPPKSPFGAISLLKKQRFESRSHKDPFSTIELSVGGNSSVENTNGHDSQHSMKGLTVPGDLMSPIAGTGDRSAGVADLNRKVTEDKVHSSENSSRHCVESRRSSDDLVESSCGRNMDERGMDDKENRVNAHADAQANVGPEVNRDEANAVPHFSSPGEVNIVNSSMPYIETEADGPTEMIEDISWNATDVNLEYTVGESDTNQNDKAGYNAEDGPSEPVDAPPDLIELVQPNLPDPSGVSLSEQTTSGRSTQGGPQKKKAVPSQKNLQGSSRVSLNEQIIPEQSLHGGRGKRTLRSQQNIPDPSRVRSDEEQITSEQSPRRGGKRRKLSSRQSLGGAGTYWESGVRRSKRIRMRPLEYWKGERFLYGRVHESLTTVIGVKYVSPTKVEGKTCLRVKSYVSDEYKELVELAALH